MKNLVEFISNNTNWPLLIEGVKADVFKTATIIDSSINSSLLGIIPSKTGYDYPEWLNDIIKNKNKQRQFLIINDIDKITSLEQEKFLGIIKHKSVNGYKLPSNVQIIILSSSVKSVAKSIRDNSIEYKKNQG